MILRSDLDKKKLMVILYVDQWSRQIYIKGQFDELIGIKILIFVQRFLNKFKFKMPLKQIFIKRIQMFFSQVLFFNNTIPIFQLNFLDLELPFQIIYK